MAAHLLGAENEWVVQVAALSAALLGAFALYGCERRRPRFQEALIGATFVVSASLVMLLLAGSPHGGPTASSVRHCPTRRPRSGLRRKRVWP